MKKSLVIVFVLIIILITAGAAWFYVNKQNDSSSPVTLLNPKPNEIVKSPLLVGGLARGYWFFEASFPVRLFDANGKEIAVSPAQAVDDWMTEEMVPFQTKLEFSTPETDTGILVLEKDNPSGLPEHDQKITVPVRFR